MKERKKEKVNVSPHTVQATLASGNLEKQILTERQTDRQIQRRRERLTTLILMCTNEAFYRQL